MVAWSLSINWESELVRLQLAARLDPTLAADLEPDYPNTNPVVAEARRQPGFHAPAAYCRPDAE